MRQVTLCYLAFAAFVLAGCGGNGSGSATLWVTRDRGHVVLLVARVPAGLTAMQALERKSKIETSYGGRFVDAIDHVKSAPHHDWFYFVNGIDGDRSAVEVRLARRRQSVVGLPLVAAAERGAGRRRRVSTAVPARPRGRGRARAGRGTTCEARPRPRRRRSAAGQLRARVAPRGRFPRALDGHHFVIGPTAAAKLAGTSDRVSLPLRGPGMSSVPAAALLAALAIVSLARTAGGS